MTVSKTNDKNINVDRNLDSPHQQSFRSSKIENAKKALLSPSSKNSKQIENLISVYKRQVLPIENTSKFENFFGSGFTATDLEAKPIVLCVGQYSTGKTSFVQYLLERDFPGLRIGPEPTTDRFVAVMQGENEKSIPGNAAAARTDKPFTSLKTFGMSFLNKFECSELDAPLLRRLTIVDTPGVLAGSEQTKGRAYSFPEVIRWFAERSDRILLFFDANKLDISDEMKKTIAALKGSDDKIRCILNKADGVSGQQLLRVYGALMWSLGKVITSPEVPRIFIGSFWQNPLRDQADKDLFEAEEAELLADLRSLPRNSAVRKINECMKRVKHLRIHCLIISFLRDKLGYFGKVKKQKKLLDDLKSIFTTIRLANNIPVGDMPLVTDYQTQLQGLDLTKIKFSLKKVLETLDKTLSIDIPRILESLPSAETNESVENIHPFKGNNEDYSIDEIPVPEKNCGLDKQCSWIIRGALKSKYDVMFERVCGSASIVPGKKAKEIMFKSRLPIEVLKQIWELSDIDGDFALDRDEFALCMHLVELFKGGEGGELLNGLPLEYIPPSKRRGEQ